MNPQGRPEAEKGRTGHRLPESQARARRGVVGMFLLAVMAVVVAAGTGNSALEAAAAVGAESSGPAELNVALNVQEVGGVARKQDVCSMGVPLPCGLLKGPEGIAVFSPSGAAVPAQFRVLERWREKGLGKADLSIKWLLVTFFADVPAGKKAVYRLKAGKNPAPANPVRIEKVGDDHKMGGLVFKKDFTAPFKLVLTNPEGKEIGTEGQAVKWSVWEKGPLRACLRAESPTDHKSFGFIAWVYAYAGKKRWDMTVVLKNTPNKMVGPFYFKDFSAVWAPPEVKGAKDFILGGGWGKEVAGKLGADGAYVYQDSDGTDAWDKLGAPRPGSKRYWAHSFARQAKDGVPQFRGYKAFSGEKELGAGDVAQGWAALLGEKRSALTCVRDFRRNHPKAAEVRPGTLTARLWPKYWKGHGGLHWLDDMQRKAHDVSFRIVDGKLAPDAGQQISRAFDTPLTISCDLDWVRLTGTRGVLTLTSRGRRTGTLEILDKQGPSHWNWITFGGDVLDRLRRRYHDHPMTGFIKSGFPHRAYTVFNGMRHSSCITPFWVDEYRFPRDARTIKFGYCNPPRKTGKYRPKSTHHGYMAWNVQHFTVEEIMDSWRLFGDPLARESIRDISTCCRFWVERRKKKGIGETRLDALPMSNLCNAYRILGDADLLKAADEFADIIWKTVNKERGYYVPARHGKLPPADKPFMLAYLMRGLRSYHELTGDERSAEQITGIVDFILAEGGIGKWGLTYTISVDLEVQEKVRKEKLAHYSKIKQLYYGPRTAPLVAWCYSYTGEKHYNDWIDNLGRGRYRKPWAYTDWFPARTDREPPAAIQDLKAEALGGGKVKLTWTAPAGDPARYQVKWAEKPMVKRIKFPEQKDTHANWWAATNTDNEPKPLAAGKKQDMVVEGVTPGTRYFAVRSFDAARTRSDFSNTAEVVAK